MVNFLLWLEFGVHLRSRSCWPQISISCFQNKKSGANAQLRSAAALVADTACEITRWYPKGTRRGLKTSSTGPMLSRFRTMLFPLGQSSNSDVEVGFPSPQRLHAREKNDHRAAVNFLLWLWSGVHLRVRSCSGLGLAYNYA